MNQPLPHPAIEHVKSTVQRLLAEGNAEKSRIDGLLTHQGKRLDLRSEGLNAILLELFHLRLSCDFIAESLLAPSWWDNHHIYQVMKMADPNRNAANFLHRVAQAAFLNSLMHLESFVRAVNIATDKTGSMALGDNLTRHRIALFDKRVKPAFAYLNEFFDLVATMRHSIANHGIYYSEKYPSLTIKYRSKSYVFKNHVPPSCLNSDILLERIEDSIALISQVCHDPAVMALAALEDPFGKVRLTETETLYQRPAAQTSSPR
jgi:hypothetical protein